jgi:hypothetical protein
MSEKLAFTIEPDIFKELLVMQEKLPSDATGEHKKDAEPSYDNPAGLALLGLKDGKLDTVVKLAMSGGCWDAPNINHDDMDKGFRKMIAAERIVAGMCLMRHNKWEGNWGHQDGEMPSHFKYQIHSMRNAFSDITQTVWIILHKGYFKLYRPSKDDRGRVTISEMKSNYIIEDSKKDSFIKAKIEKDVAVKKARALRKKQNEERRKRLATDEKKRLLDRETRRIAEAAKLKKKTEELDKDFKDGIKDTIDAGNGMSYIKTKEGKYILWITQ